jgi:hypothetical protein
MNLTELIKSAVRDGRFMASHHAHRGLRQRKVQLWQVEAGLENGVVREERPHDQPNASLLCEQTLPDGTTIIAVWAWNAEEDQALLVTVFFLT